MPKYTLQWFSRGESLISRDESVISRDESLVSRETTRGVVTDFWAVLYIYQAAKYFCGLFIKLINITWQWVWGMVPERMVEPGVINIRVANTRDCHTVQTVDWDKKNLPLYNFAMRRGKVELGEKSIEHSLAVKNMQNELKSKAELLPTGSRCLKTWANLHINHVGDCSRQYGVLY